MTRGSSQSDSRQTSMNLDENLEHMTFLLCKHEGMKVEVCSGKGEELD